MKKGRKEKRKHNVWYGVDTREWRALKEFMFRITFSVKRQNVKHQNGSSARVNGGEGMHAVSREEERKSKLKARSLRSWKQH